MFLSIIAHCKILCVDLENWSKQDPNSEHGIKKKTISEHVIN